ncbi:MFS transporter [Ornithinimicrobium sp. Y1694]|uniref:MFS transporter n=1 Tax=Ornithinimicrobium sp. Y1694 TaxID=3418590 RepID=UPI003CF21D5B
MNLGPDFARLWGATAASQVGTAVALGALPFIAITVLDADDLQVSLLAAAGGAISALLALPIGPWVEHRRKRPVMIAAALFRAVVLLSLPIAHLLGVLTCGHLVVVAAASSLGLMAELSASSAHLKALVPREGRTEAASRLETTSWLALSAGPAIGGLLLGAIGATVTVAVNAVGFLGAAVGLRSIRQPEPQPAPREAGGSRLRELGVGWAFILRHPTMRPLFLNAMVFGGMLMASSPLIYVLMLRDLGLAPWQYGLALGIPCVGGILGALLAPRLESLHGRGRLILTLGAARTLFLLPIAFAPAGWVGLVVIVACDSLMLLIAGAFNPLFVAYRLDTVPDHLMSRVSAAWSITNRVVQPAAMALWGVLALASSTRIAIGLAGAGLVLSCAFLPWRRLSREGGVEGQLVGSGGISSR